MPPIIARTMASLTMLPALISWQVLFDVASAAKPVMNLYITNQYLAEGRASAPHPPVETMRKVAEQAAADINAGGQFSFDVTLIHAPTDVDSVKDTMATITTDLDANPLIHGLVGPSDEEHLRMVSPTIYSAYGLPVLSLREVPGKTPLPNVLRLKASDRQLGKAIAHFTHFFEWKEVYCFVDENGGGYFEGVTSESFGITWQKENVISADAMLGINVADPERAGGLIKSEIQVALFLTKANWYAQILHELTFCDWVSLYTDPAGNPLWDQFRRCHLMPAGGWNWAFMFVDEGVGLRQLTKGWMSVTYLTYNMASPVDGIYDANLGPGPTNAWKERAWAEALPEKLVDELAASFVFRTKQVTDNTKVGVSGRNVADLQALKEYANITVWLDLGTPASFQSYQVNWGQILAGFLGNVHGSYRESPWYNYSALDGDFYAALKNIREEGTFFMYDAVYTYALAMEEVLKTYPNALAQSMYGDNDVLGEYMNQLKSVDFQGATGRVKYTGHERKSVVEVVQFPRGTDNPPPVATYSAADGLEIVGEIHWYNADTHRHVVNPEWDTFHADNATDYSMKKLKKMHVVPDLSRETCAKGQRYQARDMRCSFCYPGEFQDADNHNIELCKPCILGSVAADFGSSACTECPPGTASNEQRTECVVCPEGTFATGGKSVCSACPPGRIAPANNSAECDECPLLEYQSEAGQTECMTCPTGYGFVTAGRGSSSASDCVCPVGEYLPCLTGDPNQNVSEDCSAVNMTNSNLQCTRCPHGFECRGGVRDDEPIHLQPILPVGFFSLPSKPYESFSCLDAGQHCVGGETGASDVELCGGGRSGLQCAFCDEGFASMPGGQCYKCSDFAEQIGSLGMFVGILTILGLCSSAYWAATTSMRFHPSFAFCGLVGTTLVYGQMFANMASMVHLHEGVFGDFVDGLQFLLFDLRQWNMACVVGNDLLGQYIMRNLVPAAVVLSFVAFWAVTNVLHMLLPMVPAASCRGCCSGVLMIWLTFSLAIVKSVVYPLACRENPSGAKTRLEVEGVYCAQSEVSSLIPFILLFALFYILFPSLVCFGAMAQAPNLYHIDAGFRSRFEFMFSIWKPRLWFWSCGSIARSVLMALLPIFFSDSGISLVALILVEGAAFIGFATYFPTRERTMGFFSMCMGLTFLSAAIFSLLEVPPPMDRDFKFLGLIFLVAFGAGVASWAAIVTHLLLLAFGWIKGGPNVDGTVQKTFRLSNRINEYIQLDREETLKAVKECLQQVPNSELSAWKWTMECLDYALLGTIASRESSSLKGIKPKLSGTAKRKSEVRTSRMSQNMSGSMSGTMSGTMSGVSGVGSSLSQSTKPST